MKKKVLIITYYWPPAGGSGVQRWMYFAKYLPEFDIDPTVITVSEKYASYPVIDEKLNENVKNIKVFKTKTFELIKLYSFIVSGNKFKAVPQGEVKNEKNSLFIKIAKYIRGNLFIPDARKYWIPFALKQAKKIIKKENIDIVITTGPPHSAHLIGLKLKRKYSLKWIADFRDPWTDLYYNKDFNRTKKTKQKDEKLEEKVLYNADIVLTIGMKMKNLLESKINNIENKTKFIYNGYDAEKFKEKNTEKNKKFQIAYIGLLTDNNPYKDFAEAVKIFFNNLEEKNKKDIILVFAGKIKNEIISLFKKKIPDIKIEFKGYISHNDAVTLMKRSDILVSCLPYTEQNQIIISGKTAEYAASGTPVLSFGDKKSESALILEKLKYAFTSGKNDIEKAANFISKIYDLKQKGKIARNDTNTEFIKKMSRFETTRKLADLILKLK